MDYDELQKNFKTNRDKLLKQDFIKLEYARLYDSYLNEIMSHKDDIGIAEIFLKNNGENIKLSPVEEYCSRQALLNLIVENNKRLLTEIENLLRNNKV
jgi:hypothetical protein